MNNRILTALAIRFAALLIFMKFFDQIGNYIMSLYVMVLRPLFEEAIYQSKISEAVGTYFYKEIIVMVLNIGLSLFLFLKAEWIATKLIKSDSEVQIGLSPEKLIRVILLCTGVIWMASAILMIPDLVDFVLLMLEYSKDSLNTKGSSFNAVYFLMLIVFSWLFIFRVESISLYLEKRLNKT